MDPIKEAFFKIKEDILYLKEEILQIKEQIKQLNNQTIPTQNISLKTQKSDNPTQNIAIKDPYTQNINISTGNNGVPTDRPTHQQTHQQTQNHIRISVNSDFKEINNILNSLDNIKKEVMLKFKRLTPQEMLIFSILYSLEEENNKGITYNILAKQSKLSESSIRDYINKIKKKGIPIEKTRQNNKTIILNISKDLKNIATLATIQNLREL